MENDSKIKIILPIAGIIFFIIFIILLVNKFKVDRSLIGLYKYTGNNVVGFVYFDTSYSYIIYLGNDNIDYRNQNNESIVYSGKYKIKGDDIILSNVSRNESMTCNKDYIHEFSINRSENNLLNSDLLNKDISFNLVNDNVYKDKITNVLSQVKSMNNCGVSNY